MVAPNLFLFYSGLTRWQQQLRICFYLIYSSLAIDSEFVFISFSQALPWWHRICFYFIQGSQGGSSNLEFVSI